MSSNASKFVSDWKRVREQGLWSYTFTRGLLLSGSVFAFLTFVIDTFVLEKEFRPVLFAVRTVVFGITIGLLTWKFNERKYKKEIESDA